MSKIKLSAAQEEFLRNAASEAKAGRRGHAAYSYATTVRALLRRGLIELDHCPRWSTRPIWHLTTAGYAWLGLEPPNE